MKITFHTSYNGKRYDNIRDAIGVAIQDGIKEKITERLNPFKSQLGNAEIKVTAKDQSWSKYAVTINDVPDEIREQVQRALSQ